MAGGRPSSPNRVTWADAVGGHEEALRHGGASGFVTEYAIQSALGHPYHGYHRLIHQKAAALVHGIVSNHGFSDGNKRTALYLVELLVQRIGHLFVEDDVVITDTITNVARGETGHEDMAKWFRERLIRPGGQ